MVIFPSHQRPITWPYGICKWQATVKKLCSVRSPLGCSVQMCISFLRGKAELQDLITCGNHISTRVQEHTQPNGCAPVSQAANYCLRRNSCSPCDRNRAEVHCIKIDKEPEWKKSFDLQGLKMCLVKENVAAKMVHCIQWYLLSTSPFFFFFN